MLLEQVAGEGRRDRRGRARPSRPGRSRSTTSTGSGPSTWPSCPRSARACTCGRWAGSTRWTSSTGPRCRRSTTLIPEIEARTIATFEEAEFDRRTGSPDDGASWSGRAPPGRTWCTTTRSAPSSTVSSRPSAAASPRRQLTVTIRARVVGGEDVGAEVAGGAAQHGVRVVAVRARVVVLDQQVVALDPVVVPRARAGSGPAQAKCSGPPSSRAASRSASSGGSRSR